MLTIKCPNCEKNNIFEGEISKECQFCSEDLCPATGLTLTYQLTGQKIEIPLLPKIVLGRGNIGGDVFSNISHNGKTVISRAHCSIEYRNGNFYLHDEGSTNGTFYGESRINCKIEPQQLENNSFIFLGREPFMVQINYRQNENPAQAETVDLVEETVSAAKFRCRSCGFEVENFQEDCPSCSAVYSLMEVYE